MEETLDTILKNINKFNSISTVNGEEHITVGADNFKIPQGSLRAYIKAWIENSYQMYPIDPLKLALLRIVMCFVEEKKIYNLSAFYQTIMIHSGSLSEKLNIAFNDIDNRSLDALLSINGESELPQLGDHDALMTRAAGTPFSSSSNTDTAAGGDTDGLSETSEQSYQTDITFNNGR